MYEERRLVRDGVMLEDQPLGYCRYMATYCHADTSHHASVPQRCLGCSEYQPVIHLVEVEPQTIRTVFAGKVKHGHAIHWGQGDGEVDGQVVRRRSGQELSSVSIGAKFAQGCIRPPQRMSLPPIPRPLHLHQVCRARGCVSVSSA